MEILGQRNYATKRKKKASKLERKKLNCPFWQGPYLTYKTPKYATIKLIEFINKFSKVWGYKFSMKNLIAFLQTNSELSEKEIMTSISFRKVIKI
jgi:hypothetical protein